MIPKDCTLKIILNSIPFPIHEGTLYSEERARQIANETAINFSAQKWNFEIKIIQEKKVIFDYNREKRKKRFKLLNQLTTTFQEHSVGIPVDIGWLWKHPNREEEILVKVLERVKELSETVKKMEEEIEKKLSQE